MHYRKNSGLGEISSFGLAIIGKKPGHRRMPFNVGPGLCCVEDRMRFLSEHGNGFAYCVARRGVTGSQTHFDQTFNNYLARCRKATSMPLAVGFGVSGKEDIDYLKGKADIAVIGTKTINLVEEHGVGAVGPFIAGLR